VDFVDEQDGALHALELLDHAFEALLELAAVLGVSDFGVDELAQMLDAAEAIRRTRRV
jgi:hypothetical protein